MKVSKFDLGKFSFNRKTYQLAIIDDMMLEIRRGGFSRLVSLKESGDHPRYVAACLVEARRLMDVRRRKTMAGGGLDLGMHRHDDKLYRLVYCGTNHADGGRKLKLVRPDGEVAQYVDMDIDLGMAPDYVASAIVETGRRLNSKLKAGDHVRVVNVPGNCEALRNALRLFGSNAIVDKILYDDIATILIGSFKYNVHFHRLERIDLGNTVDGETGKTDGRSASTLMRICASLVDEGLLSDSSIRECVDMVKLRLVVDQVKSGMDDKIKLLKQVQGLM